MATKCWSCAFLGACKNYKSGECGRYKDYQYPITYDSDSIFQYVPMRNVAKILNANINTFRQPTKKRIKILKKYKNKGYLKYIFDENSRLRIFVRIDIYRRFIIDESFRLQ